MKRLALLLILAFLVSGCVPRRIESVATSTAAYTPTVIPFPSLTVEPTAAATTPVIHAMQLPQEALLTGFEISDTLISQTIYYLPSAYHELSGKDIENAECSTITALRADGNVLWEKQLVSRATIDSQYSLICPSFPCGNAIYVPIDHRLLALCPETGDILWQVEDAPLGSSYIVGPDDVAYISGGEGVNVSAIDSNGNQLWHVTGIEYEVGDLGIEGFWDGKLLTYAYISGYDYKCGLLFDLLDGSYELVEVERFNDPVKGWTSHVIR